MKKFRLNIDGKEVFGIPGQTILEVARENDVFIPTLCFDERTKIYGACGLCVVECEGMPKLLKACATEISPNMIIKTNTKRVVESRKTNLELLLSNHVGDCRPPCALACPAGTDCQGYVGLIANGEYEKALELVKDKIPLPAAIGRVCPHPCEEKCRRSLVDEPISIANLKRFVADRDLKGGNSYIPDIKADTNKSVAIIGGGPMGLSSAYFLRQKGHDVTIIESMPRLGGMLRYGIPSYKLEKDVLDAEIDVAKEMGVEIKTGIEVGKDVTIQQLREQGYQAFYIAIGCSAGSLPDIKNINSQGVMTAIDYLHESNCGNIPFDGKVVVVGGGNVAIDASRVSSRNKASQVQQFCLEQEVDMPASNEEIAEAREDGVTIHCGWGPQEIIETNGKVSAIVFKKCVSVFNDEGKFAPVYDENTTVTVACERVIFAIGQRSVWGDLLKGEDVKFNGPAIELNKVTFQSSVEDIFAGGDVYTGPKFAIDAIAQGKIAAESLHRYVHHGHMETGRNRWEFKPLDTDDILVESYDRGPKQVEGINSKVTDKFKDNVLALTEEQIKKETSRCLGCGATIVDANKCIGCGICTTKCDFDAIKLHRDHPECSTMTVAEDKFKAIIPYQLKRVKNIILKKKVEH